MTRCLAGPKMIGCLRATAQMSCRAAKAVTGRRAGLDQFVFKGGWGKDVITDFSSNDGEDIVLQTGALGFADMVQNHLQTDMGTGFAKIVYGANSILLIGYCIGDFGAGDLISAPNFAFM
jgi:hypothetical protein